MREKWRKEEEEGGNEKERERESESGRWHLELPVWAVTKCENGRRSKGKDGRIRVGGRHWLWRKS